MIREFYVVKSERRGWNTKCRSWCEKEGIMQTFVQGEADLCDFSRWGIWKLNELTLAGCVSFLYHCTVNSLALAKSIITWVTSLPVGESGRRQRQQAERQQHRDSDRRQGNLGFAGSGYIVWKTDCNVRTLITRSKGSPGRAACGEPVNRLRGPWNNHGWYFDNGWYFCISSVTLAHRKWVYEAEKGGSSEIGSCKISFRSQRFSEPDWGSREIILKSWRSILIDFGRRNLRTISCLPGWSVHKLKMFSLYHQGWEGRGHQQAAIGSCLKQKYFSAGYFQKYFDQIY